MEGKKSGRERRRQKKPKKQKTEWRKDAKELGHLGQGDSFKKSRRRNSSGLRETVNVFVHSTKLRAEQAYMHQLDIALAHNNKDS